MHALLSILRQPRHQPLWRGLFVALIAVVSWLAFASMPGADGVQHLDKARHLAAFTALAAVAAMAWRPLRRIAFGLLAYGVFVELVQTQIPGRQGSVADVAADLAGIALGLWLVRALRKAG